MIRFFEVRQIRDFGSLITDSFYYLRRHFRLLGKSILYFVIPLIAVSGLLVIRYTDQTFELSAAEAGDPAAFFGDIIFSALGSGLFTALAMTALAAVVYTHIGLVAGQANPSEQLGIDDVWQGFKENFLGILLISILVFIATFFGMLFFIIPGIFIGVKLVLTSAAYVLEDRSIGEAFSRSWNLVTNHWWTTFGLMIVMYIFVMLMSYAISLPFFIVSAFSGFAGLEDPRSMSTLFGIFYGLTTSLTYIFYTILYISLGLHFYNLLERKEGAGLQERISQIDDSDVPK